MKKSDLPPHVLKEYMASFNRLISVIKPVYDETENTFAFVNALIQAATFYLVTKMEIDENTPDKLEMSLEAFKGAIDEWIQIRKN